MSVYYSDEELYYKIHCYIINYAALADEVSDYPLAVNMDEPFCTGEPISGIELSTLETGSCEVTGFCNMAMIWPHCDCSENFNFVDEGRF